MNEEIPDNLIIKNLAGESNIDDDLELWKWMESDPKNQKIFENAILVYTCQDLTIEPFDIERRLGKIMSPPMHVISPWWSLAACVSLVSILSALVLLTNTKTIVSNAQGIVKKHVLPDLSQVWLNGGSSISYDARTYEANRRIELNGEAYFQITASSIPFVIEYDSIQASLRYGELNIQAYDSDEEKISVVGEGLVTFQDLRKKDFTLTASTETEVVSRSGYGLVSAGVNQNVNFNSWRTGVYAFNGETIKSIFSLVKKGNNVSLPKLSSRASRTRVSGVFELEATTETIDEFLSRIFNETNGPTDIQL